MRTQWKVLPIPQVLVNFINKLCEADDKDNHIGQDPVSPCGDPNNEEIIMDGDEDEQLGMPEDMEATDRAPARVRDMPDSLVEEYLRNAFSTSYNTSETQEEDEVIDV